MDNSACNRCGKCCTNPDYMGSMLAAGEDVKRWTAERRWDILQFVDVLGPEENPFGDLWIDRSGNERARCPFVRKDRNRPTYRCMIYETRPEICRRYVPWSANSICEKIDG